MKALIDTNVLLDVFLRREPFFSDSKRIFQLVKEKKLDGYISVQSLKDIFFLYKKFGDKDPFYPIQSLLFIFNVIDVTREDSVSALTSDIEDFEDGLLAFSAIRNNVEAIITRNEKDFWECNLAIIDPKDIDRYINGKSKLEIIVTE